MTEAKQAEAFIQAAIDSAPEPMRRLGEWLASKLDDDDWKTADRLVTGAAVALKNEADKAQKLERELAESRAECERLRGLLWYAWHEFNAIRARSGVPLTHDGMPTCSEDSWNRMTEAFAEAIGPDARKPWPSAAARAALKEPSDA